MYAECRVNVKGVRTAAGVDETVASQAITVPKIQQLVNNDMQLITLDPTVFANLTSVEVGIELDGPPFPSWFMDDLSVDLLCSNACPAGRSVKDNDGTLGLDRSVKGVVEEDNRSVKNAAHDRDGRSVKGSPDRSVKDATEESYDRSVKDVPNRSVKDTTARSVKDVIEDSHDRSVKDVAEDSYDRSVKDSHDRSVKDVLNRSVKDATEDSHDRSVKDAVNDEKRSIKEEEGGHSQDRSVKEGPKPSA